MKKSIKLILLNIAYLIICICILYNVVFSINTTIFQKDYLKIFGISLFKMDSNLMQGDINKGDLVVVKEIEEAELQKGDIIAYTVNGKTRINKIINKQKGFVTKSNKNYYPDLEQVTYNQIIGKKVMNISFWGVIIGILQSKITSAFILIVLILHLIHNKYIYTKKIERAIKKKKLDKG